MLNVVDRVVYQALLNKEILGNQIISNFSDQNFYPRLSKSKYAYIQGYKGFYPKFIKYQESATIEGYAWRGEFDVSAFYDNVSHKVLFDRLKKDKVGSERTVDLLQKMLKKQ